MRLIDGKKNQVGRFGNRAGIASCFIYGCLSMVILVVIGLVVGYFVARSAAVKGIEAFTEEGPMEMVVVELSDEEYQDIQGRLTNFVAAVESSTNSVELSLTSDEVNGLISRHEAFEEVNDKFSVFIEDDQLMGIISIPLEGKVNWDKVDGRYLNGTAALSIAIENGVLDLRIESIKVGETSLPEFIQKELMKENLAKDWDLGPEMEEGLKRIESFTFEDGKVLLKLKGKDDETGKEEETETKGTLEPKEKVQAE
ncbi:hypothetical protein N9B94_02295 [Verrucomicrobia bacterium]|nr:hypothetical protein [Verrucomicrobiota bacterium]MDB4458945.1 hypothetical protein [bacterium]